MNNQPELFPPSAVTGSGRLLGDWPINRAPIAPVPDTPAAGATQDDELPFGIDEEAAA